MKLTVAQLETLTAVAREDGGTAELGSPIRPSEGMPEGTIGVRRVGETGTQILNRLHPDGAMVRVRPTRWHKKYTPDNILEAFAEYAKLHGRPPTARDWSAERDPDYRWPRSESVAGVFEKQAEVDGHRRYTGDKWVAPKVLTDLETGEAFNFSNGVEEYGEFVGVGGWEYALERAGFPRLSPAQERDVED